MYDRISDKLIRHIMQGAVIAALLYSLFYEPAQLDIRWKNRLRAQPTHDSPEKIL